MSDLLEKLDKLALAAATIDDSLGDVLEVVEISQVVDSIKEQLTTEGKDDLAPLFSDLSSVYEKFMLYEAPKDSGPLAIDVTNDVVVYARDMLGDMLEAAVAAERLGEILSSFKEKFGITSGPVSTEPDKQAGKTGEAPAGKPDAKEAAAEASGETAEGKFSQVTTIKLIDENDAEIYEGFLDEATDQVNHIEEYVMALEENPEDMEIINACFRVFHSLKGAAGFLGLNEINCLCHDAEDLLDLARKSEMAVDGEFIDIVLAVRDVLEKGLTNLDDTIRTGKANLPNFEGEVASLEFGPVIELIERKRTMAEGGEDEPPKLGQILLQKGQVDAGQLQEALDQKHKPVGEILVEMGATTKENVSAALDEQEVKKTLKSASIKVDTQKLNLLLDLVGELVISQSIISESDLLKKEENSLLGKDITEMAKITAGIQDHIMSLRMVPLKQTFQKMARLVRDLSRKTDKQVTFEIYGEDTEIDKTIVEVLNDPLVHLLRNSVDHGIDTVEERLSAGKSPAGTVSLGAHHKGGNVVIEIKDDGRGLDLEKIRQKGIERGLIEKGREYSDSEIHNLIFLPGFSTHKVATSISGRGVGMDVVRRGIEGLGGRVDISSEQGKGSSFSIILPLTMAIVDGMLVQVGTERYIIPTVSISESLKPKAGQISSIVAQGEVIDVRGELIPLLNLHELFDIPNGKKNTSDSLVIIAGTEKERRGLLVDDLLGQQQVVIKNLDKRFSGMKGFSGSSILGDGQVGLIMDVGGLFEMTSSEK